MNEMKKTIFLDIDGCIFKHKGNISKGITEKTELLSNVIEKINQWDAEGHKLILVTGRKESLRKITEKQLLKHGVFYDQLIMGINRGERIIINDKKPNNDEKVARAIEIERNIGLTDVII